MKRNSGFIGKNKTTSINEAEGTFDLYDQYNRKKVNRWPATKYYSVAASTTTPLIGQQITFTISTEGVLDGDVLYYTLDYTGSTTSHWTDNALSGSFEVVGGSNIISKTSTIQDNGSSYNITFNVRTGSTSGPIVASETFFLPRATFSITPTTPINEGNTLFATLVAENVTTVTLYWSTTAQNNDATSQNGSFAPQWFTYGSSGIDYALFTIREDALTEGTETYTVYFRRDSTSGPILASSTFQITDTSTFVSVTPNVTNVNEGSTVQFTITTTDYAGTLAYDIIPTGGATADDFNTSMSAAFNIVNNSATINVTLKDDLVTDGTESFYLRIYNQTISGFPTLGNSTSVTINDTSTISSTQLSTTQVNEGGSVTVLVFGTSALTTTLYWTAELVSGNALNDTDFSPNSKSGSFTYDPTIGPGQFTATFASDGFTEGLEEIRFNIRTGSTSGPIVATTSSISVNDTSTGTAEPSGIGGELATIESTLSSYSESTAVGTVVSAIEGMGYTVLAIPRYGALAEQMSGVTGTLTTDGRFRYDLWDSTTNYMDLSGGFSTSALNGYPYLCYAGFDNGAFQGTAVMMYRDYTSSTTLLKNLFYPNQDRNLFTHLRYSGGGVLENSSTSPTTSTIYSDGQNPGTNGYNSTSRFASDDGAWGYVNGVTRLDGNGGPYHSTNITQAVGCANQNGGDTTGANYFYFGANGRSGSTTYKFYIFTKFV